jgi:lycopene cyclase domain-containing protein
MSYTAIAIFAVITALALDRWILKVRLTARKVFWTSYAIILPFQLLTNWWLTSRNIVIYDSKAILGLRLASAPVEDLLFGFSLILSVLTVWIYQEKR